MLILLTQSADVVYSGVRCPPGSEPGDGREDRLAGWLSASWIRALCSRRSEVDDAVHMLVSGYKAGLMPAPTVCLRPMTSGPLFRFGIALRHPCARALRAKARRAFARRMPFFASEGDSA